MSAPSITVSQTEFCDAVLNVRITSEQPVVTTHPSQEHRIPRAQNVRTHSVSTKRWTKHSSFPVTLIVMDTDTWT